MKNILQIQKDFFRQNVCGYKKATFASLVWGQQWDFIYNFHS